MTLCYAVCLLNDTCKLDKEQLYELSSKFSKIFRKTKKIIIILVVAIVIVAVALGLYFGLQSSDEPVSQFRGAVVANGFECAQIGR